MRRTSPYRLLWPALLAVVVLVATAHAQGDAARVAALLRQLKDRDYEIASAAARELDRSPRTRVPIVAGLIDALRTGEWDRCGGDMRDSIARTLIDLKAKEAVVPLLDLVKSGKAIDHECVE